MWTLTQLNQDKISFANFFKLEKKLIHYFFSFSFFMLFVYYMHLSYLCTILTVVLYWTFKRLDTFADCRLVS